MDERLTHLREAGMPDAAGLVLASDQDDARAYAAIVKRVTGTKPALILSDDPKASKKISAFATGTERFAVCVRMISEGVDVPRAACLAWMTSYRTPLFFAQAVGRVVRARRPGESATVFLPAVRPLLALAAELESERNHVLPAPAPSDDSLEPRGPRERTDEQPVDEWQALGAEAEFAHVLHGGRASRPRRLADGGGRRLRRAPRAAVRRADRDAAVAPRRRPPQARLEHARRRGRHRRRARHRRARGGLLARRRRPAARDQQPRRAARRPHRRAARRRPRAGAQGRPRPAVGSSPGRGARLPPRLAARADGPLTPFRVVLREWPSATAVHRRDWTREACHGGAAGRSAAARRRDLHLVNNYLPGSSTSTWRC
jgi:superfamily II DNA or RNA helicase